MKVYCHPELRSYNAADLIEVIGPVQAASATMNVYGGRTAQLGSEQAAEYRFVQAEINYGILTKEEVRHA